MRFLCLAGAIISLACTSHAEELRFCYDPYPPFTIVEEGKEVRGIKVDILAAVVDRIDGLSASIEIMPWQRCQATVLEGRLDGILPLFPNDERRGYMDFTVDVLDEQSVFWFSRAQFPEGLVWSGDFDEISDLRLGMLRGGYVDRAMEDAFAARGTITRSSSIEALFLMLEHNRIDLVATDLAVGHFHAAELGLQDRLESVSRPISTQAAQFGLSRLTGAAQYLGAFNKAILDLQAEGRIKRMTSALGD